MESRFDLTEARTAWLATLESSQAFPEAQLLELGIHLDDAMEDLQERGLTPPEAFLVATHRLGGPAGLAEEYQKLASHPVWAIRGKWMMLGIVCYLTATALTRTGTEISGILALTAPQGNLRLAVTVCGFLLSSIVGVWLLHRCLRGKFPRRPVCAARHPLRTACGVLLAAMIIPAVSGILASLLSISTVGLAGYGEQMLFKRWTSIASPLLWLVILAIPLSRYWRKAAPAFPERAE